MYCSLPVACQVLFEFKTGKKKQEGLLEPPADHHTWSMGCMCLVGPQGRQTQSNK